MESTINPSENGWIIFQEAVQAPLTALGLFIRDLVRKKVIFAGNSLNTEMFLSVSHALCAGVACVFLSFTSTFIFYFLFLLSLVSVSSSDSSCFSVSFPAFASSLLLSPSSSPPSHLSPPAVFSPPPPSPSLLFSLVFSLPVAQSFSPLPGSPFPIELASIVTVPVPDSHST